ncbi:MAG: pyridoxal phosphate-dependent aminotransferase [Pseudorhodobacter sp.]
MDTPFRRADRLKDVTISASAAMTDKATELKAQGLKVISLSSGEPDFPTPPHVIEAAHAAVLGGDTKYPPQTGKPALLRAVQAKFRRDNGLDYALDQVLTGNGGKQLIFDALMAGCNRGDEVLVPAPGWITYADIVHLAGAVPVRVDCPESLGFRLDPASLAGSITPRTRWLILNFPNNPTGAMCTREDLREIADILLRHPDIWVISDDIYEHLIYSGNFATIAQVEPRLKDRTITINGLSKAYAMTGWRVGYAGGPKAAIAAMNAIQLQATGGICTAAQAGAVAALEGPQDYLAERLAIYRARRDLVVEAMSGIEGVSCRIPDGAFYVFPGIAGLMGKLTPAGTRIETDTDFVLALLAEAQVTTVQGSAYGMSPYFRISYAAETEVLKEACDRIVRFCQALR